MQRIYPSEEANRLKPELIEKRKEANQEILEMFSPEERVLFKRFLRDMI